MRDTRTHPSPATPETPAVESRSEQTARLLDLAAESTGAARAQLLDRVVELNLGVARAVAQRFRGRGEPLEDLEQVAALGLVKAVRLFAPERGKDFLSYAVPTIRGEVKRHFRDHAWTVRPPRRIQELQPRIARASEELTTRLNRSPRPDEVAAVLGVSTDEVIEALTCDGCFHSTSLDVRPTGSAPDSATSLHAVLGHPDAGFALTELRAALAPALVALSDRDRHILARRVDDGWTQQEIADELGVSQMQVSRVLARIRARLARATQDAVA